MSAAVVAGLRCWAQGAAADEAAVELLTGCLPTRFTQPGCAWVRPCRRPGWWWLDPEALARAAVPRSADEARVLALVVALLGDRPAAVSAVVRSDAGRAAA